MKRRLINLVIVLYLGALFTGIGCHTLSFGVSAHPAMYFFVWDMFCGWSSYACRVQLVGEGESGAYYELSPGPWGDIKPYGDIGRRHYDIESSHSARMALNTLKQTHHEPITRIFIVEESWAKKYNLPDHLWSQRFSEPKDPKKYFHIRHVITPDGDILESNISWLDKQNGINLGKNPRLMSDARRSQPFFAFGSAKRPSGRFLPGGYLNTSGEVRVGSPLGN